MSEWTLMRHKAYRDGRPAALYWVQVTPWGKAWREKGRRGYWHNNPAANLRYPLSVNAPGVDSPAIRPPELSPSAGTFPVRAINELYRPISVESATSLLEETK